MARESSLYRNQASWSCLRLCSQAADCAFVFALNKLGSSIAARMAMMAMTTRSSISVKPRPKERRIEAIEYFERWFVFMWFPRLFVTDHWEIGKLGCPEP